MQSAGLFARFVVRKLARLSLSPPPLAFVFRGAQRNDALREGGKNEEMVGNSGWPREPIAFTTC